jgi:predicted RNA methylase
MSRQYKYLNSNNSNKLELDQYYTPKDVMEYCVNKTIEVLENKNCKIDCFLEPSAGQGVFSVYLHTIGKEVLALDIEPKGENIIEADFLEYPIEHKENRLIIGNPPFGARLSLAKRFYKKSIEIGDYISFILPISQLNNTQSMYEFDLVYSEDLGKITFSETKKVHCCLNVYVKPQTGLNKKKTNKLKDIEIVRQDSKKYKDFQFDLRMCYWGDIAGKMLSEGEKYAGEYKIKIHNENLKGEIIKVLKNANWEKEINSTAMCSITQYHIIELLKREIPEIK